MKIVWVEACIFVWIYIHKCIYIIYMYICTYETHVKRDVYVWNETYIYGERPICIKSRVSWGLRSKSKHMWRETPQCWKRRKCLTRDLYVWKLCEWRPVYLYGYIKSIQRDMNTWEKIYMYEMRCLCMKKDLHHVSWCQCIYI